MPTPTDLLWRVNNQYRKHLAQAQTYLQLLYHLIAGRDADGEAHLPHILEIVEYAVQQIENFTDDHRAWRAHYYFAADDSARMVQQDAAVDAALNHFADMRLAHDAPLRELFSLLTETPRPDPALTTTPARDLWSLAQTALEDLMSFDEQLFNGERL